MMYATNHSTGFNPNKKLNINASTPNNSQIATCKLFVGNLATHTTGAHLQAIFHSYGQVIECVKVRERYGFVRFASGEEAQRALLACNGIQLNGYPMIVEYAQNEILISPLSPRTTTTTVPTTAPTSNNSSAPFRPHPYHAGRSNMTYQHDNKLTTPITINTNHRHPVHHHHQHQHHHHRQQQQQQNHRDDIPLLSAAPTDPTKYASSTLNPDASAFTLPFSPSNHYHSSRSNQQKNVNHENACSSSDYYSQSGLPSSGSASVRSTASLSPSILSAISPSMVLPPIDSPGDESMMNRRMSLSNQQEKRQSISSTMNLFIGDKILSLYGTTGSQVDTNNSNNNLMGMNQFDCRDIDPRDPIFIWNFVFYPDVSISPFVKRNDIKTLLERRVSLYSR